MQGLWYANDSEVNIIDEIRNDTEALSLIKDWLGDGAIPVRREEAESRASKCAFGNNGKLCPKNRFPKLWERVKSSIADVIKRQISLKSKMELSVSCENRLFMCKMCGCCLPLMVHVPDYRLKEHKTKEQFSQAPDYCWVKSIL